MLGVSASTLRTWERRYSYPTPHRSEGGHRQYELGQIQALHQALEETHNVSSAVSLVRERGSGPPCSARLAEAFAGFDEQLADRQLEESLALRSVERTVEEVLLPAVASQADGERPTPAFEFGWRHATGWLSAHKRLSPPAVRDDGVLILDPWTPGMETLHAQALELVLRRAGLRTLSLSPATDRARLSRAIRALEPRAVVLCGRTPLDDDRAPDLRGPQRRLRGHRVRLPPRGPGHGREHRRPARRLPNGRSRPAARRARVRPERFRVAAPPRHAAPLGVGAGGARPPRPRTGASASRS